MTKIQIMAIARYVLIAACAALVSFGYFKPNINETGKSLLDGISLIWIIGAL